MKGPMLQYEIRALRLWRCPQCGRTVRAAGNVVSRMCGCSGTDHAMTLVDRAPQPAFDASPFVTYEGDEFRDEPEPDEVPVEAGTAADSLPPSDEDAATESAESSAVADAAPAVADSASSTDSRTEVLQVPEHDAPPDFGTGIDVSSSAGVPAQSLGSSDSPNVLLPADAAAEVPPEADGEKSPAGDAAAAGGHKGKRRRGRRRGKRRGSSGGGAAG